MTGSKKPFALEWNQCVHVGCPNLIGFPSERRGMSREESADNAVAIFSRVKGHAERKNIKLCMEITNSKVVADQLTRSSIISRGDSMVSSRQFAAYEDRLCMYYVQISMETSRGTCARTEFHLPYPCGPGPNPTGNRQHAGDLLPLYSNAIVESGYTGFVAHEWGPGRDPIRSLRAML